MKPGPSNPLFLSLASASYPFLRPLLFRLKAEQAHHVTLKSLQVLQNLPGLRPKAKNLTPPANPIEVMGLSFPNRLGLAAGMDKSASCVDGFAALGFGFVEVGTLTPRPQEGNPQPRLFRLLEHEAIINRMGFNNPGIDQALENLKKSRFNGILGINIGKNASTPVAQADEDYLHVFRKAAPRADYIAVNISSPNTKGLRDLQEGEQNQRLLTQLTEERRRLEDTCQKKIPLAVKIAPDLESESIRALANRFLQLGIDAVIATNTTIARPGVSQHHLAEEGGGLSGKPLRERATEVITEIYQETGRDLPIIGVGGILHLADAREKLEAGASLLQIYSGIVYRGPKLIAEILDGCS